MKTIQKAVLLFAILSIAFISCSKDDATNTPIPTPVNSTSGVYVAGYDRDGPLNIATVWKDGIATNLTDGKYEAHAYSVFVTETDVYVAGDQRNAKGNSVATMWKNGLATNLSDALEEAEANAVTVAGNDVYVAGYEGNGIKNVAKVWKNGVATNLSNGQQDAEANAITVSGSDVYVAGYESNGTTREGSIWVNGVKKAKLTFNDGGAIEATGIAVVGTNVYVSSSYRGDSGSKLAHIWIAKTNDFSNINFLTNKLGGDFIDNETTNIFSTGTKLFVSGVGGTTTEKKGDYLKYWTFDNLSNGGFLSVSPIETAYPRINSRANGLFVKNNDIYIVGFEFIANYYNITVWKNGVPTVLGKSGRAHSVFVK